MAHPEVKWTISICAPNGNSELRTNCAHQQWAIIEIFIVSILIVVWPSMRCRHSSVLVYESLIRCLETVRYFAARS